MSKDKHGIGNLKIVHPSTGTSGVLSVPNFSVYDWKCSETFMLSSGNHIICESLRTSGRCTVSSIPGVKNRNSTAVFRAVENPLNCSIIILIKI